MSKTKADLWAVINDPKRNISRMDVTVIRENQISLAVFSAVEMPHGDPYQSIDNYTMTVDELGELSRAPSSVQDRLDRAYQYARIQTTPALASLARPIADAADKRGAGKPRLPSP